MKEKRRNLYKKKAFLNKDGFHSDANIVASIDTYEAESSFSVSAYLAMKDCHSKMSLSIDLYDERNYRNTIHKLDKLIGGLQSFREACKGAREWYIEAEERVKQRIKARQNDERKKSDTGGVTSTGTPIPAVRRGRLQRTRR